VSEATPFLRRYLAVVVVLALGLACSLAMHHWARETDLSAQRKNFSQRARHAIAELDRQCLGQVQAAEELRDLVVAGRGVVDRATFRDHCRRILGHHQSARALGWCQRVSAAERNAFEERQRLELAGFTLHEDSAGGPRPAERRSEHLPLTFLHNAGVDLPFVPGFDLASVPAWTPALSVVDGMNARILPSFEIADPRGRRPGLAVVVPVLTDSQVYLGRVLVVSVVDELVQLAATDDEDPPLRLTLEDARGRSADAPASVQEDGTVLGVITVADRHFAVRVEPGDSIGTATWLPDLVLAGGLALTLLAVLGLSVSSYRSGRTERLITSRTSELRAKVTEHARSEAALSVALSENAILAAAVANTTAGVLISDPNQRDNPLIFVNRAFTHLTGYTDKEAIGRNSRFLEGVKTDPLAAAAIQQALSDVKPIRAEILNYRKDGTTFWNDLSITPVYDDRGLLVYWVGIQNDVSEQKLASLALKRERDRLQRQLGFANALAAAAEVVVAEEDNRTLLGGLAGHVGRALGVDRALIFDVDLTRRVAVGLCEWLNPEAVGVSSVLDLYPLDLFKRCVEHIVTHHAWLESHDDAVFSLMEKDGCAPLLHGRMGIRSLLWFPFQFRPNQFYLLVLNQVRYRRAWKHDEIAFLESVSKLTSVALEKIRLIAQRRMTEEAVRANEMRYRAIVEDQSELICRFRSDSTITFANEAYCRYFGRARADLEGHSFMPLLPEEDREIIHRQFAALLPDANLATYSHRVIQNDGGIHWVQWTVRGFFDEVGQAVEYQAVGQDITERKQAEDNLRQSEASFRSLVEQAPEGILISDLEGNYVEANPVACGLIGYPRAELLRMNIRQLLANDDGRALDERMRLYRDGHTLFGERQFKKKGGGTVQVEMIAKLLPDKRLLAIVRDLSERLKLERSLREAKDAAENASLAKSAFLANMSHEIRTPMNGILGMVGLILESPLDAEVREFAETARLSGEHLLTIINDILDFSKIEADRLELEHIVFELPQLIEDTVALFAEQAQGKGLELVCYVHTDVPPAVRGDPSRLRQVLINLIGNAVKFTTAGEVVIRVAVDDRQVGGNTGQFRILPEVPLPGIDLDQPPIPQEANIHLRVTVADTGPGIPEEAQPRMFQAFSQADSSTTRRFGGTGLGLAISRHLVELMGGSIGFASTPAGTTFYFSMTLALPDTLVESAVVPDNLRELRLLVVDDNATCRDFLVARLVSWGLKAEAVQEPGQALAVLHGAQLATPPVSVVIIDLEMPGIDGLQLARTIREDPDLRAVHLIALTTLNRRGASQEAKRLGATACLTKPVRSVPLLDALLSAVGAAREPGEQPRAAQTLRTDVRVLVADDNLVNRRLALAQLSQLGIKAEAVSNGKEALNALERTTYDLVFMDGQMPELDGYLATAELRRREGSERHTTVVAMTADALSGDRERCLAAGMDDYLSKPVKIADLRTMLGRWLPALPVPATPIKEGNDDPFGDDSSTLRVRGGSTETHERPTTARYRRLIQESGELDPAVIEDLLAQGGVTLVATLGESLRQEAVSRLPALERAVANNDNVAALAAAHHLKGAAWSLGLRGLASACLGLEHALDVGMADTARLCQEIVKAYERGQAALDAIVKGRGS
jgi:two-component system, sensor histidine kinase and response regulator